MQMKKWAAWLLALWLLPAGALAAVELNMSADSLAVESILDFTLDAPDAQEYRYTLYRDDKKLFATQAAPYGFGSYLPREAGEYTLRAEAHTPLGWESAQADFTVTEALSFSLSPLPPSLEAGDGVKLDVSAKGGNGEYRYLYSVQPAGEEKTILEQEGDSSFLWVPGEAGEYTLTILVADGMGAWARQEMHLQIGQGPGISWEAAGGALLAHGGQKSWIIYAEGPWRARSQSDFIEVIQGEGNPGDVLILEIKESTASYRAGKVILESGGKRAEMNVGQSAGNGIDEDISLSPPADPIRVEGAAHTAWLGAKGAREFSVHSPGAFRFSTENDFIHPQKTADGLSLEVAPWEGPGVRKGAVILENGDSMAAIHVYQAAQGQKDAIFQPEGPFPMPADTQNDFVTYSQFSGYWKDKKYRTSTLEHSGCAIFALSHALQHLGYEGEETRPETLAQTYAFALLQGGTMNSTLVGHAGDDLGFKTRYDLYEDLPSIRSKMDQGAVYSFGVVTGHIAMIIEKNEAGNMFRVVDSAPSATWERIKNASLYIQDEGGNFIPISDLSQIPGIRYYIETESFGGATYWLEGSYIAKRGVRLIQPEK